MDAFSATLLNTTLNPTDNETKICGGVPLRKRSHFNEDLYRDFYSLWITLIVVNTIMFVVGVVLNGLALYVFCLRIRLRTAPVVYTINLAVADLLVALSLPARIALYHSGGRCLSCSYVHTFSYFVNMYCSILFLTSICVDRYMAVVWAGGASLRWRSPGVAKSVSVAVWLFAVVITYSLQTTAGLELEDESLCCRLPLLFALTVLEFVLPLLIIAGFTARVACALADPRLMPQSCGRRARAVRLLVAVLVVFAVCFTPFHVRQAVVYFHLGAGGGVSVEHAVAYHATVTLSSLNSCLDPVVYCFVPDNFRSALWRACRAERREKVEQPTSGGDGDVGNGQNGVATITLTPCTLQSEGLSA